MSKKILRLLQLLLTLSLIFFLLPKTTLADVSTDCEFHFYDASDIKTEITPNQNMSNLTVVIKSTVLPSGDYWADLREPGENFVRSFGRSAKLSLKSGEESSAFTFLPIGGGWKSGDYQLFISKDKGSKTSLCKTNVRVSDVASQPCITDIENRSSLTPNTPPVLLVNGLKGGCYDIYVNGEIQSDAFCADGKTRQNLKTFIANKTYTVQLKTQCWWFGDKLGQCIPRLTCNPTQFTVNPLGGAPPSTTESICNLSPDPAITKRPISTLDNVFITAAKLTPQTTYAIWGRKSSDPSIYLLGNTKTDAYGNLSFALHKPTSQNPTIPDSYDVRIYNQDNQEPRICSIPYTIQDANKIAPPASTSAPCTGEGCTKGGGDSCDVNGTRGPGIKTAIGCVHTNPAEFVKDLLKWVIGIGGGIAFLMMLLGVFQMLTSAGNPETLQAGRDRLTSAVIGLLFIIFAVLLMQIIGVDILGIPGFGK